MGTPPGPLYELREQDQRMSDIAVGGASLWDEIDTSDQLVDALFGLYERRGWQQYNDQVTHEECARQAASFALVSGVDDEVVVAALFHGVGHLLVKQRVGTDERGSDVDVARGVGARFLANWFGPEVSDLVLTNPEPLASLCDKGSQATGPTPELDVFRPIVLDVLAKQAG